MAASPIRILPKDPDATLDYTLRWKKWLNGDILDTVTWTIPVGLSNAGEFKSGDTATIWLAGGVEGTSYLVAALITTEGGRTDERTFQINAVER